MENGGRKADSRNSGPLGEGSIFTFREFEEGRLDYSSESQGLEKSVVVTGRWAEARSSSNQTDILQRYSGCSSLWDIVIVWQ